MISQVSVAALFAGLAAAYHAPVGNPSGNPITRPLNEIVPACKPFSIEWTPTTSNTVSLVLLKGPSTNVIPVNAIVEGIANSGKFTWTPPSNLEATTTPTGYGLQIIDDVNGQYQYSTQFGISKDGCASAPAPATEKPSAAPVQPAPEKPAPAPVSSGYNAVPKPSEVKTPASKPTSSCTSITVTKYVPATTGTVAPYPPSNGTFVKPSKPAVTGAKPVPSAGFSGNGTVPPTQFTGAGSTVQVGMGVVGLVAAVLAVL